jgi:hypothetical protein
MSRDRFDRAIEYADAELGQMISEAAPAKPAPITIYSKVFMVEIANFR